MTTSTTTRFQIEYSELERFFQQQVDKDNAEHGCDSIYLPNISSSEPVDFVLIAMEPSLGRWARSLEEAQEKIDRGFRNFAYSIEDFVLHFCVRRYLCLDDETYHITDISKGAMLVRNAESQRQGRYDRWYPLLKTELREITKPEAKVISIGNDVGAFLRRKGLENHAGTILHYSPQAAKYREDSVKGREQAYQNFASEVKLDDIEQTAEAVLEEAQMKCFRNETLKRIRRSTLSDSRKKLMFTYKVKFEELRATGRIACL